MKLQFTLVACAVAGGYLAHTSHRLFLLKWVIAMALFFAIGYYAL